MAGMVGDAPHETTIEAEIRAFEQEGRGADPGHEPSRRDRGGPGGVAVVPPQAQEIADENSRVRACHRVLSDPQVAKPAEAVQQVLPLRRGGRYLERRLP